MLHASLATADRQLMPLLTVKKISGPRLTPFDPNNTVHSAEIRNAGLGPALGISAFLEARKDTVTDTLFDRVDLELETTFLPVDGKMIVQLALPSSLIFFQPFVVEYLSADEYQT